MSSINFTFDLRSFEKMGLVWSLFWRHESQPAGKSQKNFRDVRQHSAREGHYLCQSHNQFGMLFGVI